MADDFDIDKFLSDSFAVIEKKITKNKKDPPTLKKVDKFLNKFSTDEPKPKDPIKQIYNLNISDYNFDKMIDNRIYQEIGFNEIKTKPHINKKEDKVDLENLLKPLFPNEKVYQTEFKNSDKAFLLDRFIGNSKKKEEDDTKKFLSTNMKINKFKKFKESEIISQLKKDENLSYKQIYQIHIFWKGYISSLLNKTTQPETIYNKMLKCDLHGAVIEVIESKNKNLIGIKGINLLETRRTFNLINENNEVKTVLKKGTAFKIDLPYDNMNYSVKILGDNFMFKAVERTKTKFKNKYNL